VNRDIAANLDEQQKQIDGIAAQDNARIRGTKEDRNAAKLAALSSQYNAAADAQQQGFGNIIQGAGMAGTAASGKRRHKKYRKIWWKRCYSSTGFKSNTK
jgi:hypothetical protein